MSTKKKDKSSENLKEFEQWVNDASHKLTVNYIEMFDEDNEDISQIDFHLVNEATLDKYHGKTTYEQQKADQHQLATELCQDFKQVYDSIVLEFEGAKGRVQKAKEKLRR